MKLVKICMVFTILQFFYLCRLDADNLSAIRVIVNGEIITEFDVRMRVAEAFRMARERYSGVDLEQKQQELILDAIDELIDRRILVQEAKKGIRNHPEKAEEIEARLEAFLKGAVEEVGSLVKFYELANKQGINPLKKKAELKEDIMVDELLKLNVYRKIVITPREIKQYYTSHIDDFSIKEQLSFRQILLIYSRFDEKEEARTAAEKILKKLKDGESFEASAKKYSQGPHSSRGGLWGTDEVKDFRKDLVALTTNLKIGETSDILKSSIGYHIFKIEERIPPVVSTFQEAQKQIRNAIFREKFIGKKNEYLKKLRQNVTIKRYY